MHPKDPNIVYVAAVGHLFGPNPERGVFKIDRRRQDLDEHQVHRQRHGLHRSRDAPDRPQHALRGVLSAPPAAVGLQRRRPRQRHLADERRRQDLDAPHGQWSPDRRRSSAASASTSAGPSRPRSTRSSRSGRAAAPVRASTTTARWCQPGGRGGGGGGGGRRRAAGAPARSHQERRLALRRRRQVVEIHEQQQQPPDVLQQDPGRSEQPGHRVHDRRERLQISRRRQDVQRRWVARATAIITRSGSTRATAST